jgi:hypothetical protein
VCDGVVERRWDGKTENNNSNKYLVFGGKQLHCGHFPVVVSLLRQVHVGSRKIRCRSEQARVSTGRSRQAQTYLDSVQGLSDRNVGRQTDAFSLSTTSFPED